MKSISSFAFIHSSPSSFASSSSKSDEINRINISVSGSSPQQLLVHTPDSLPLPYSFDRVFGPNQADDELLSTASVLGYLFDEQLIPGKPSTLISVGTLSACRWLLGPSYNNINRHATGNNALSNYYREEEEEREREGGEEISEEHHSSSFRGNSNRIGILRRVAANLLKQVRTNNTSSTSNSNSSNTNGNGPVGLCFSAYEICK